MKWNELVDDFERIIILKTHFYNINLNYLSKNDLINIQEIADELEIINLSPMQDTVNQTYNTWEEEIYTKFEKLQNQMYGGK